MKCALLCLSLLMPACSFLDPRNEDTIEGFALTWYCVSPEGCERAEEVALIDRATTTNFYYLDLESTQDPSYSQQGELLYLDSLPYDCVWAYYLSFFGHDLERTRLCYTPGGFELELSIPNQDPATHSEWVVSARDLSLR